MLGIYHCYFVCKTQAGVASSTLSAATSSSSLSSSVAEGDSDAAEALDKDGKKKKNRCATCRKKVGLTGMQSSTRFFSHYIMCKLLFVLKLVFWILEQVSNVVVEGSIVQCIDIQTNTSARLIIVNLEQRRSVETIRWWSGRKFKKSEAPRLTLLSYTTTIHALSINPFFLLPSKKNSFFFCAAHSSVVILEEGCLWKLI